jgi:hypothetical protein
MTQPWGEDRSRLYHNQYRYAVEIRYPGSRYIGVLNPERVMTQYRSMTMQSWNLPAVATREQVLEVVDDLISLGPKIKLTTSWENMFVYTNDANDYVKIRKIPHVEVGGYREALVTQPTGVLLRRDPKYQYRSYFREKQMPIEKSQEFVQFVDSRGDYFNLDRTTRYRLTSGRHRYPFARHSFIEYNNPLDLTMLEMVIPGAIRQTLPIQAK